MSQFPMMAVDLTDPKLDWRTQETFRLLKNAPGTVYQECNDDEKRVYRNWVQALLHNGEITVTFAKADGALREMRCTLNFNIIPEDRHPKLPVVTTDDGVKQSKKTAVKKDETQSVFDLDKNEWRSFRYDRLKKINANINLG